MDRASQVDAPFLLGVELLCTISMDERKHMESEIIGNGTHLAVA